MQQLVLTVIAADRAGLVERLALCVADHQGNWLESRMSRMAGQFAGILRVSVPADHQAALIAGLQTLGDAGLRILVAEGGGEPDEAETRQVLALELIGNDRPGIVRDITRVLADLGVNVERLSTEVAPAPMSNEPLFRAEARLSLPAALSHDAVQARLEGLADDLMVELSVRPHG